MEWYHVGIGLLGLLMLFIGIGLPIPFALAAASMPFLFYIQGWSTALVSSELKLWGCGSTTSCWRCRCSSSWAN